MIALGSYNFGDGKPALDTVADFADVFGTQEAGDRDAAIGSFLDDWFGWAQYGADLGGGRGKVPVLFDGNTVTVIDSGTERMGDRTFVGKAGAGPSTMDAKWLTWLLLETSNGFRFTFANTHAVPSIYLRKRRELHAEHLRRLTTWAKTVTGPVVIVGDFNATWTHPHFKPLKDAGFRCDNPPGVTHPKTRRRIDLILSRDMTATGARLLKTTSDHRSPVVTYNTPAPEEKPAVTYRHLTDLADAARKSGLKVIELPGWKTNGRPTSTGGYNPRGVLCHHTGSYDALADAADDLTYAKWLAREGRPGDGLPAPLCQLSLSAEGVVYVCAAGRANHAGDARQSGAVPSGDGNELYIGIEAMNSGTQGWSPVQYDAYVRLCRALIDHYGWTADHVRAHRETSHTGKWDPGGLDMARFRDDIATQDATQEDDDMRFDDELYPNNAEKKTKVIDLLRSLDNFIDRSDARHKATLAAVNNPDALADRIAEKLSTEVPAETVKRAVKEALREGVK